jgi:hypothetical protein
VAAAAKPVGADVTAEDMGRVPRARLHLSSCTREPATPTPHLHHLAPMAWLGCHRARAGHRLRRGIPRGTAPQDSVHGLRHRRARTTLHVAASGSRSRASSTRCSSCAAAKDGARRAGHRALLRETWLPPAMHPAGERGRASLLGPARCRACRLLCRRRRRGLTLRGGAPITRSRPPSRRDEQVGEGEEGSSAAETEACRRTEGCLPSRCGPLAEEGAAPPRPGAVSGGGGGLDHERDRGSRGGK